MAFPFMLLFMLQRSVENDKERAKKTKKRATLHQARPPVLNIPSKLLISK
jgi:hypothetical protein